MGNKKIIKFSNNLIKGDHFSMKIETEGDLSIDGNTFCHYENGKLVWDKHITEITSLDAFTGPKYIDLEKRRNDYAPKDIKDFIKIGWSPIYNWEIPNIIGIGYHGYYLKYHYYLNAIHEQYFMIDGKRVTKEENELLNSLKCDINGMYDSWGLSKELNFITLNVKVENIISIKQGNNVYGR